jgi:hypothetical protein
MGVARDACVPAENIGFADILVPSFGNKIKKVRLSSFLLQHL